MRYIDPQNKLETYKKEVAKRALQARRRWDKLHLLTLSCRVPFRIGFMFREICENEGLTRHQVLKSFVYRVVQSGRL